MISVIVLTLYNDVFLFQIDLSDLLSIAENQKDDDAGSRDSVEYTLDVTLKGGYKILDNLEAYGSVDFIYVKNPGNLSYISPRSDLQLTLGISYAL